MPPSPHVTPRPAPARPGSTRWLSPPRPGLAGLAAARKGVVTSGRTPGGLLDAAAAAAAGLAAAAAAARGAALAEAVEEAAEAAEAVGEAQVAGVAGVVADDPGVVSNTPCGAGDPPPPLPWLLWR